MLATARYVLANDFDRMRPLAPKEGRIRPVLDERANALTARGQSGHTVSAGHRVRQLLSKTPFWAFFFAQHLYLSYIHNLLVSKYHNIYLLLILHGIHAVSYIILRLMLLISIAVLLVKPYRSFYSRGPSQSTALPFR